MRDDWIFTDRYSLRVNCDAVRGCAHLIVQLRHSWRFQATTCFPHPNAGPCSPASLALVFRHHPKSQVVVRQFGRNLLG